MKFGVKPLKLIGILNRHKIFYFKLFYNPPSTTDSVPTQTRFTPGNIVPNTDDKVNR